MNNLRFNIFGVPINIFADYYSVYSETKKQIQNGTGKYITINNVHTVVEAVQNPDYKKAIVNSSFAIADGRPLSLYAKWKSIKPISRICGPTLFEKTLEWGQKDGLKHFFFGSSEETLIKMINTVKQKYPRAIIVSIFSPPFKKFTQDENKYFLDIMNKSEADIFWIGLGAPKQELWMFENYIALKKGIMIGVGAGFDYLAGNIKHAPEWMKNIALEWLYRLIQEPKRLWKRYLITNTLFLLYFFLELYRLKKYD